MKFLGITWANIEYAVIAVPLLAVMIVLIVYRFRKVGKTIYMLAGSKCLSFLQYFSPTKHWTKLLISVVGVVSLLLALLRPQWGSKEEVVAQKGRDLMVALDVSRSMLATDVEPDRLSRAKQKIKQLVQKLSSERVGLLLFSGSAFVQSPLTTDYRLFSTFLDHVDAEAISSGTTAIDQAIKQTLQVYEQMPSKKNKLLVIFTDGEDFSSNLGQLKQQADKEGLHIFTVGIGTEHGAPIPMYDERGTVIDHIKDTKGNVVISRLNEGILSTLAHDAGGVYVHMGAGEKDIDTIVRAVKKYEKEHFEDKKFTQQEDRYPYFLFVSLFCFALEWLL